MSRFLLLVGAGTMGGALLAGWRARGIGGTIFVVEPNRARARAARELGARVVAKADQLAPDFRPDVIVLAVKPQVMVEACTPYRRYAARAGFLSIAAGRTLAGLSRILGEQAAIVRAMPNLPAAVGRGVTVACANDRAGRNLRAFCNRLLTAVGDVAWVKEESLLDAVTAVSGSGPAYVFLLIECLAKAGQAVGLERTLASRLALATVSGAGELARRSRESAAQLRAQVTSPGGTTEAAMKILGARGGFGPLLKRAVKAAAKRSRELSG
jgi:pyrroline-5-carboxylate reductase